MADSSPFAGESLSVVLDVTQAALGKQAAQPTSLPPTAEQLELERAVGRGLAHTDHMEAALAHTGPYVASLQRDILPKLLAHSKRLDSLFNAIDAMADVAIPAVEQSLDCLEEQAQRLEADRAALEPSAFSAVFSYFGGSSSSRKAGEGGGANGGATRAPWMSPELFEAGELMDVVKHGGTAPLSPDGNVYSPVNSSGTSISKRQIDSATTCGGDRDNTRSSNSTRDGNEGENAGYEISVRSGNGRIHTSANERMAVANSAALEEDEEGAGPVRLKDDSECGLISAPSGGDGTDGDELVV